MVSKYLGRFHHALGSLPCWLVGEPGDRPQDPFLFRIDRTAPASRSECLRIGEKTDISLGAETGKCATSRADRVSILRYEDSWLRDAHHGRCQQWQRARGGVCAYDAESHIRLSRNSTA